MIKKQKKRLSSELFFHAQPENLNCAQAILKGFQKEFGITNQEITAFQAWGGGRADGGLCGALFAAERLLIQIGKESVIDEFREKAGGIHCCEIKDKKYSCAEFVKMADELIEKHRK